MNFSNERAGEFHTMSPNETAAYLDFMFELFVSMNMISKETCKRCNRAYVGTCDCDDSIDPVELTF